MKKIFRKLLGGALLFGLTVSLTSCEDVLGHWEKPTPNPITPGGGTPTVDDVIKYGFKVTDLNGDDKTTLVTSLKMSNSDGPVATAEVSGGKITIKADDLKEITTAIDFWFEAEIDGKPYIAKVNIDPTKLSPETPKTLEMATLGDVILSDGKFAARSSTGTKVAMIAYLGSETGVEGYAHGLALALSDEAVKMNWSTATGASGAAAHTPAAPTTTSSWMLPSKDQWNKMIDACMNVLGTNNNYQDLRDGFESVGGTNMQSDRYWSSTEDGIGAWDYNFVIGSWSYLNKDNVYRVRACLAF